MRLLLVLVCIFIVPSGTIQAAEPYKRFSPTLVTHLDGFVAAKNVNKVITGINLANNAQAQRVVLVINSPGGYVYEGIRLIEAIEDSKVPVICVVNRFAGSMAFHILQACDQRIMTVDSILLAHEPYTRADKEKLTCHHRSEDTMGLIRALAEYGSQRMTISTEEFMERTMWRDWKINWEEAFELQAVDMVVHSFEATIKHLTRQ